MYTSFFECDAEYFQYRSETTRKSKDMNLVVTRPNATVPFSFQTTFASIRGYPFFPITVKINPVLFFPGKYTPTFAAFVPRYPLFCSRIKRRKKRSPKKRARKKGAQRCGVWRCVSHTAATLLTVMPESDRGVGMSTSGVVTGVLVIPRDLASSSIWA